MAQYVLKSDKFTAISETEGTLVNISNVPAEVSLSEEFGTGIILFPHQQLAFAKAVYAARAPGSYGRAIVATIATGGLQAESFTQEDVYAVFDEGGGDIPIPTPSEGSFTQEDIDAVFADDIVVYEGFTEDDVMEVFKGGHKPKPHHKEHFTPADVDDVFDYEHHKHHHHHDEHFTKEDFDKVFDDEYKSEILEEILAKIMAA